MHPIVSWVAIVVFVAGYIRLATTYTNNDTSHTLAVVTLFFYLLFAVYITGHVGNFRESGKLIEVINSLNSRCPMLFPPPELFPDEHKRSPSAPLQSTPSFAHRYAEVQAFSGVNNSWRPQKHMVRRNILDRRQWQLLFQSFLAVLISWLAAFLLSFFTPAWGLGHRSGSWTVVFIGWLVSAALDLALRCCLLGMSQKNP